MVKLDFTLAEAATLKRMIAESIEVLKNRKTLPRGMTPGELGRRMVHGERFVQALAVLDVDIGPRIRLDSTVDLGESSNIPQEPAEVRS